MLKNPQTVRKDIVIVIDIVPGVLVYLSWGKGLLRARSNWRHAVAVTLPIIGESSKIKFLRSKMF